MLVQKMAALAMRVQSNSCTVVSLFGCNLPASLPTGVVIQVVPLMQCAGIAFTR